MAKQKKIKTDDVVTGALGGFVLGAFCGAPVLGAAGGALVGANYDKIKKKFEETDW